MSPYGETRRPFEPATPEEIFTMLTGETNETLRVGMTLAAQIVRVKERFMICQLASGVEGILGSKSIDLPPYEREDVPLTELYSSGQHLEVRVMQIHTDKISVELSAKASDLTNKSLGYNAHQRDPHFSTARENQDLEKTGNSSFLCD